MLNMVSPVPLGYVLVEVEKRGTKTKRTLAIDPVDAETVQLIFKLYLYGDGSSGALGVKEVVKWLNSRGYRTRKGKTFGTGTIYKILTNTIYIGEWKFNQMSSRTGKRKPDDEVITTAVPAIIERHVFEQVRRQLHAQSPKVAAPRVTTGPILLTGLAVCATCEGARKPVAFIAIIPVRPAAEKERRSAKVGQSVWRSWTNWSPLT
jgi:site-specific DNA recombinase